MRFADALKQTKTESSSVDLYWLGQAGFLLKTAGGKMILIDPYLSNSVYEQTKDEYGYAFKRVTPALFEPEDMAADLIFCSHEHGDHMDTGSVPALVKNGKTRLYANPAGARLARATGVPADRIEAIRRGMKLEFGEFTLLTITAQHGELSPEAMGFLLDFGFTRIYYSGDTAYDPESLAPAIEIKPEVALLPINGAYGNLNAAEAASFAKDLQAKVLIPHHFWTFPKHLGSPQELIEAMPRYAPDCALRILTPGELFTAT